MIGWCSGGCTDENCTLGGRVHRMKDPGICSTKRGFFWSSDRGASSYVNTANGHNAPDKRPPNTLGLDENHILPWNTENGSCALGICDCCNEIGRNCWCNLGGTLASHPGWRQERSEFLVFSPWTRHLGLAQWAWQNCTQHPAGTAVSHPGRRHTRLRLLSPGIGNKRGNCHGTVSNRCRHADRCRNSNWHPRHQHCDLPKVHFLTESCQMTLVDVTHVNQLMHHGPKSIITSHLTIRRLWSLRRIILQLSHHPRNWVGKWRRGDV